MLSVVIIDDQEICTEMLLEMLSDGFPGIQVVGVAHSGEEGIQAIRKHEPDLVILDVEMPGMNGLEMLQKTGDYSFEVIFTTGHEKYSIDALRLSALDYLLKPVMKEDLKAAIERASGGLSKSNIRKLSELLNYFDQKKAAVQQVALPASNGLVFINISDIIHCESDSNYTTLAMTGGKDMVISKTLKEIEKLLPEITFYRIHNSFLINLSHVRKYIRGNAGYIVMSSGKTIPVGRNRKEDFLKRFAHL